MKTPEKTMAQVLIKTIVNQMIVTYFPRMPAERRDMIVDHACSPNCGRIFSTNDEGKMPDITPALVTSAVKAHVRHKMTDYDAACVFDYRNKVRNRLKPEIRAILKEWRA